MIGAAVMSYADARMNGIKQYFTGRMCPSGHRSFRYASTGNCVECANLHTIKSNAAGYYRNRIQKMTPEAKASLKNQQDVRRELNRERYTETQRAWVKRNPDLRRATANSYKHRRRATEATGMSGCDLARWTKAQEKVCHWCSNGCADAFHVDHVYPLSKGGSHREDNLVIACPDCNRRKGAKDPIAFAAELRAAA